MDVQFQLAFADQSRLNAFVKTCESLAAHSDTLLVLADAGGLRMGLTDAEGFCALEVRYTEGVRSVYTFHPGNGGGDGANAPYSAKVLVDSLVGLLRAAAKSKSTVTLTGYRDRPRQLFVRWSRAGKRFEIESAEHRPRVFYRLGAHDFIRRSQRHYAHFEMPMTEWIRLTTQLVIISGLHGGVAQLAVTPGQQQRCTIAFSARSSGPCRGSVTIETSAGASSVPVHHRPARPLTVTYLLTYAKRCQKLFSQYGLKKLSVYVSPRGMLLRTPVQHHHACDVFIANVANIDLHAY